ncbi:MAG: hypothetical protein R3F62_07275 [Planctomycetota bacterium]
MRVLKFGGSCLQDGVGLPRVVERVVAAGEPTVVVLSALKGVTDRLRSPTSADLEPLRATHARLLVPLSGAPRAQAEAALEAASAELAELVAAPPTPARADRLLGWGERTLTALARAHFAQRGHPVEHLEGAAAGLVTDATHGHARLLPEARERARAALADVGTVLVPGFVGQTPSGVWTTLGRGGSDTTAAFLGVALDAPVILYKDTALLSADPAWVPEARVLSAVDPRAALALAEAGLPAIAADALRLADGRPLEVRAFHGQDRSVIAPDAPPVPAVAWVRTSAQEARVSLLGVAPAATSRAQGCLEAAGVSAHAVPGAANAWVVPLDACPGAVRALHRAFVGHAASA